MLRTSNFFYEKSTILLAIIASVLSFGYLFIVMIGQAKGFEVADGKIFLGTSFGFSYETVLTFLSARNPDELKSYKSFLSLTDVLYPAIYGMQYVFWISYLYKPFSIKAKWINILPILPVIFDWLENFQLVTLTNQYLDNHFISTSGVHLASSFSMAKWITSILIFLIIIIGIVLRIRNYLKKKKQLL